MPRAFMRSRHLRHLIADGVRDGPSRARSGSLHNAKSRRSAATDSFGHAQEPPEVVVVRFFKTFGAIYLGIMLVVLVVLVIGKLVGLPSIAIAVIATVLAGFVIFYPAVRNIRRQRASRSSST